MRKKLFIISCFFWLTFSSAQTNVYHHMPDSAAKWCISYTWGTCGAHDEHTTFMQGDTAVSGRIYYKLYRTGYYYCMSPHTNYYNQYVGAFREDTVARKVYFMASGSSGEYLLYDLSLGVGGTWAISGKIITVTAIDSILVGISYRKRFLTNVAFSGFGGGGYGDSLVSIIEGIGATDGMEYTFQHQGVEEESILNAFMENGVVIYSKNMGPCDFSVDIHDLSPVSFDISPNPTIGIISLEVPEDTKQIQIVNSLGKEVKSEKSEVKSGKKMEVQLFESGIYFIHVTTSQGVLTKKVIVSN